MATQEDVLGKASESEIARLTVNQLRDPLRRRAIAGSADMR